ncbi:hypothetical protein [Niabella beijingensis]|uniref:hypothetical protein n=1 Tax=Niabella beijingensis TaxID=2872700 RepID=UPI001CC0FD02|nr:hypothetical protein [Niabella beijingensis]MBZ4192522.1 hypothetical protein [Niabella beijingensis]
MAKAYLQITLNMDKKGQESAADVYNKYKAPFLNTIKGALSKELLVRDEGVQVLHGFETAGDAQEYLLSALFNKDIVEALKPWLRNGPDIRIYSVV